MKINNLKNKLKFILSQIISFVIKFSISFLLFTFLLVFAIKFINPPTTSYILTKQLFSDENEINYTWINLDKTSKHIQLAVIASEDQMFADHYGFDLKQIELALEEKKAGKRTRGASTITQQVAKNLFLWHGKSIIRKVFEAYFTFIIELTWDKKRILEVYLNIVELGKGVYGVESASQKFFKKSASKLTAFESALLAAVLPNPVKRNLLAPSNYLLKRANRIMREMDNIGGISYLQDL